MAQITRYPPDSSMELYNAGGTNYEFAQLYWSANTFYIRTVAAGTGLKRNVAIVGNSVLAVNPFTSTAGSINMSGNLTSSVAVAGVTGTFSASTAVTPVALRIAPTINQSSTAGYTALHINPTETAVGTGLNLLIDAQVGGSSKFTVSNTGVITGLAHVSTSSSTATAVGTTTMTIASAQTQVFTGSSIQTVKLPTTGVVAGQQYTIINQSGGDVTVQSSAANTIGTLLGASSPTAKLYVALQNSPTDATHWREI